jgi:DNA-binding NtrC family response regulator
MPTPVIHIAAESSVQQAVAAIRMGAVEYLCCPFVPEDIWHALEAAERQKRTGVPERYFGTELPLELKLDSMERELICDALQRAGGVVGGRNGAAKLLGVTRTGLLYKMKRLHISRGASDAAELESAADAATEPRVVTVAGESF